MADKPAIYCITNEANGKKYVGSSNNVYYRIGQHKRALKGNRHVNDHLQSAWDKYGEDSFTFSIIEACSKELLWEREQYYIDEYGTLDPSVGYNKTNAQPFTLITDEIKRKMSEAKKGVPLSEEHRKKIGEGIKGRKFSEESLKKMSESAKNRKRNPPKSEATKEKIRQAALKRKYTDEQKKALSDKFKGKPRSEETKRKIRETWAKKRGEN